MHSPHTSPDFTITQHPSPPAQSHAIWHFPLTPTPLVENPYNIQRLSSHPPRILITTYPVPYSDHNITPTPTTPPLHTITLSTLHIATWDSHTNVHLLHTPGQNVPIALLESAALLQQLAIYSHDTHTTTQPSLKPPRIARRIQYTHHIHLDPTHTHISLKGPHPTPLVHTLHLTAQLLQYAATTLDTSSPILGPVGMPGTIHSSYLPLPAPDSPDLAPPPHTRQHNFYHRQAATAV